MHPSRSWDAHLGEAVLDHGRDPCVVAAITRQRGGANHEGGTEDRLSSCQVVGELEHADVGTTKVPFL